MKYSGIFSNLQLNLFSTMISNKAQAVPVVSDVYDWVKLPVGQSPVISNLHVGCFVTKPSHFWHVIGGAK